MTVMIDEVTQADVVSPNTPAKRHHPGFMPGNKYGKGNPHGKRIAKNCSILMRCSTEQDVKDAYAELMKRVRKGDMAAIHEFLDRFTGKVRDDLGKDERTQLVQMFLTQVNVQAAPTKRTRTQSSSIDDVIIQAPTGQDDDSADVESEEAGTIAEPATSEVESTMTNREQGRVAPAPDTLPGDS